MSDPKDAGAELLAKVRRELARSQHPTSGPLYRVVEVGRDPNGRLVRHAKIWHADLDVVRRFGRALAANSVAQQVTIGDAAGATIEEIAPPPAGVQPPGWQGWRETPLPPLPRPKPPKPRPVFGSVPAALAHAPAQPPRDLPVLAAGPAAPAFDEPQTSLGRPSRGGDTPPADDLAIERP